MHATQQRLFGCAYRFRGLVGSAEVAFYRAIVTVLSCRLRQLGHYQWIDATACSKPAVRSRIIVLTMDTPTHCHGAL